MMKRILTIFLWVGLGSTFLNSCSSRKKSEGPVVLRFVADQDLGLVAYPIDWMKGAEQDNPGVDCTLRLETQGPPENIYSCIVKDAQNVFIVRVHEGYITDDFENRRLVKVSVDTKWAVTRDFWIETLLKAGFVGADSNPKGTQGSKWLFVSPDKGTQARIFWNAKSQAVSVWLEPFAKAQVP
jgi:hypothetical protein